MSAIVHCRQGLADSLADLFDPIDAAPIDRLLAEHHDRVAALTRVAAVFADERTAAVLPFLIKGAEVSDSYHAEQMFSHGRDPGRRSFLKFGRGYLDQAPLPACSTA